MNWDQLKKNAGSRIQLVPMACRLDEYGRELPPIDGDWLIESVTDAGVRISSINWGHVTTLGRDHIHHFTSNPGRSQAGIRYGFLTLNIQIFLQGKRLWVRPNARPGEPVKPQRVAVTEKWVDLNYPFDSGLQTKLEGAGFSIAWCLDTKLSRKVDLEGWEIVVEPDAKGIPTKYRLKDLRINQTLIKKQKR